MKHTNTYILTVTNIMLIIFPVKVCKGTEFMLWLPILLSFLLIIVIIYYVNR